MAKATISLRHLINVTVCAFAFYAGAVPQFAQTVSAPLSVSTLAGQAGARQIIDGTGAAARFYAPAGMAIDGSGNVIIADTCNNVIRKMTPTGVVTLFAGAPLDPNNNPNNVGAADGPSTTASFHIGDYTPTGGTYGPPIYFTPGPKTLGIDGSGNVYVPDTINDMIRKITPSGVVTTIAGSPGLQGSTDGSGSTALFDTPSGAVVDSNGNIFITDSGNDTIRKITPSGTVSTFAGSPRSFGSSDGTGSAAQFTFPNGIAIDGANNLYVADTGNHIIRKITPSGVVTTIAGLPGQKGTADGRGSAARFNTPHGIAVDASGNIYVADTENHSIRKISSTGTVSTIAGTPSTAGTSDGIGSVAQFNEPYGIAVDSGGTVYIADSGNDTIRKGIAATNSGSLQITAVPPAKIQVLTGASATFKIVAAGVPSPTYQWYKDGSAIAGATNPTYSLGNLSSSNAGNYSVTVTSGLLIYTSALTQLQVFAPGTPNVPTVTIVTQPTDTTVAAGQSATFAVEANSAQSISYQWMKNGDPISGATNSSYTITSAQAGDAASYTVTASDGTSTATTAAAALTVTGTGTPATPSITSQPSAQTVAANASVTFTVSATGNPAPTYQWQKDGVALLNSATISGATTATLNLNIATASDAGTYTVVVSNSQGSVTSNGATLTVGSSNNNGPTAWLSNLSVRSNMGAGQTLIVGFTVSSGGENVLVRAIGPGLATTFPQYFPVNSVMSDPRLAYYPNGANTATSSNDDWDSSLSTSIASVGAFPLTVGSKDAAFVQNISGPNNTVWVQGTGNGTVLVEAYALNSSAAPRLSNLSARNHVGTDADILISGFVLKGSGTKRLLIRGIGPALADVFPQFFSRSSVLADPKLEIYDGNQNKVAENNDWDSSLATTFDSVGAYRFTAGSKDAAIIVTLPASDTGTSYTAQVKGNDSGTGEGVVEVYELP